MDTHRECERRRKRASGQAKTLDTASERYGLALSRGEKYFRENFVFTSEFRSEIMAVENLNSPILWAINSRLSAKSEFFLIGFYEIDVL
jgi:hypothetical protein